MSDAEGKEVILTILGPGEFFGEMGLIDDEPRSASVVAIEACELLCITKRDFKKCLAENFEMAMAVMRGLVRRLREADRKIGSLALLDVYGRVARLLLDMSENVDGEKIVTKRLPKQDIAKMIGASREMVSRVMKDLQMGGYIEMRGSNIVLRDTIAPAGVDCWPLARRSTTRLQPTPAAPAAREARGPAARGEDGWCWSRVAVYLLLIFATFHRADPGWSHSATGAAIAQCRRRGRRLARRSPALPLRRLGLLVGGAAAPTSWSGATARLDGSGADRPPPAGARAGRLRAAARLERGARGPAPAQPRRRAAARARRPARRCVGRVRGSGAAGLHRRHAAAADPRRGRLQPVHRHLLAAACPSALGLGLGSALRPGAAARGTGAATASWASWRARSASSSSRPRSGARRTIRRCASSRRWPRSRNPSACRRRSRRRSSRSCPTRRCRRSSCSTKPAAKASR